VTEGNTAFQSVKEQIKDTVPLAKQAARFYGKVKSYFAASPVGQRENKSALYSEKVVKHIRETIDMDRTFAFCLGGMAGLLYLMDRTQKDKAAKMIKQLLDTYGPASPQPFIADIQPVANADENYPDYIITFLPGIESRISPEGHSVVNSGVIDGKQTGTHEQNGIFLFHGNEVKSNFQYDAQIIDINPTLLVYLGIPVPNHIDGKTLSDIFIHPHQIRHQDATCRKNESADYSDKQQSEVEKRLADLGYL
jgi:hypothetical protein